MNEKKKPGCLWRVMKFGFLTIILIVASGYFLCWRTPEFKLTPERVGWTLPEVPQTEDGKFTDHGQAFELAYPEIFANPHKNGWRRVLLAAGDGVFYDDWVADRSKAVLAEEFLSLHAVNDEKFVLRDLGFGQRPLGVVYDDEWEEFELRWHAVWTFYLRRMDIPAESVSGDAPMRYLAPDGALRKEARAALVAYAHDYAEKHPEVAADPRDIFEDDEHRPLGASEHDAPGTDYVGMRVPYDVCMAYEQQVTERLKSQAWVPAEHPELAAWVESQSAFLDIVAEAAREEVYCPIFVRETAEYPVSEWAYPVGGAPA